jgi:hypothetical protein
MREFRIGWVAEATKIMVQQPHWTRCSIVSKGLRVRYGHCRHSISNPRSNACENGSNGRRLTVASFLVLLMSH